METINYLHLVVKNTLISKDLKSAPASVGHIFVNFKQIRFGWNQSCFESWCSGAEMQMTEGFDSMKHRRKYLSAAAGRREGVICWLMLTHGSVSHPGVFLVWTGLGCVSWRKSWESCVVHMKESEWEGLAVVTSNVDHDRSLCDAKLLSFWRSTCRSHS